MATKNTKDAKGGKGGKAGKGGGTPGKKGGAQRMWLSDQQMTMPPADQALCQSVGGDPNIYYYHSYWKLAPDEALRFVARLEAFRGTVRGSAHQDYFVAGTLAPRFAGGRDDLALEFRTGPGPGERVMAGVSSAPACAR